MESEILDDQDPVVSERTCIVTRETLPSEMLIRFVVGPDDAIVPDVKKNLPGRGCSVKAERAIVEQAVKKQLFRRALKRKLKAADDLPDMVDRLLVKQMTGMMNLARKAGQFISGTMKVDNAIRSGEAIGIFHATDAAADGVRKVAQARKAWVMMTDEEEPPIYRLLSYEEMHELMGDNAFIHAVALAGQAGEGVVKRAKLLETYRGNGTLDAFDE